MYQRVAMIKWSKAKKNIKGYLLINPKQKPYFNQQVRKAMLCQYYNFQLIKNLRMLEQRQIGMSCHHQKLHQFGLLKEFFTLHKLGLAFVPSFPRSFLDSLISKKHRGTFLFLIGGILLYEDHTRFTVFIYVCVCFYFFHSTYTLFFYFMITIHKNSFTSINNSTFQNFIIDETKKKKNQILYTVNAGGRA